MNIDFALRHTVLCPFQFAVSQYFLQIVECLRAVDNNSFFVAFKDLILL